MLQLSLRSDSLPAGPSTNKIDLAARLTQFWRSLPDDSVAILVSNPEFERSLTDYPYRQNSDILYLNGFPEPESVLIVTKLSDKKYKQCLVMLVRPRDKAAEVWSGRRAGVQGAKANYLADLAYPIDELESVLKSLLPNAKHVYYKVGVNPSMDKQFEAAWRPVSATKLLGDPTSILHEQRLIKTAAELDVMRHASKISAEAHCHAMRATRPGARENQLQAVLEGTFTFHGASGVAYGSIVGGGNNACVLHYVRNSDTLNDGDLVLVDAACEYAGYASDITRTWPVNGRFSDAQKEIYELVLAAEVAGIKAVRPGVPLSCVHDTASRVLRQGLRKLGLIGQAVKRGKRSGQSDDQPTLGDFYMHGTSHWLGLDVHDVGSYDVKKVAGQNRKQRVLEPGMVITVEPGLYFDKSDTRVPRKYRGIGIRVEDDVIVTADGCEVMTSGVPKTVAEIESLMAATR